MRALFFLPFLLLAVAVLAGTHFYLWAKLVRDTSLAEPWRTWLAFFFALNAVLVPIGMILARTLSSNWAARALTTSIYIWMGFAFLLFAALFAADAVQALTRIGFRVADLVRGAAPKSQALDLGRRIFLSRGIASGAVLAAAGMSGIAIWNATSAPAINRVSVRLRRLPKELDGLVIAQISDLHIGPSIGMNEVRRVIAATNALEPDVIAITGDLVDASVEALRPVVSELAALEARYGVYFVTGNHEYYVGADEWIAELDRIGIRVLRNEHVSIGDPGGPSFDLAGIDDFSAHRFGHGHGSDLARALSGRAPDRSLVLLAHQPRLVSEAVQAGVELMLTGHTHGGQIFPFSLLVGLVYPYWKGLYTHREPNGNEGQIFVSCGTGYWGPPLRLGAPAEITRVELKRAE